MDSASPLDAPFGPNDDDPGIPVFARWIGSWRILLRRRAMSARELEWSYDRAAPGWAWTLDRLGVPAAYERLLGRVVAGERADGAFDLVLTGHVLEHLGDPRRALQEMTRVLEPGGLLVACLRVYRQLSVACVGRKPMQGSNASTQDAARPKERRGR